MRTVQVLIANGANPNILNEAKQTPLFSLCGNGSHYVPLLKFLLVVGSDPNKMDNSYKLPLTMAIKNSFRGTKEDRIEIIRLLIKHGANANARSWENNFDCPIAAAILEDDSVVIEILVENGLDVSLPIRNSQYGNTTPLDYARMFNKRRAESTLLKHGAKASRTAK